MPPNLTPKPKSHGNTHFDMWLDITQIFQKSLFLDDASLLSRHFLLTCFSTAVVLFFSF